MQDKKPKLYWIIRTGERLGPETSKSIRRMAVDGTLFANDVIQREDEQVGYPAFMYFPILKDCPRPVTKDADLPPYVQVQTSSVMPQPTWLVHVPTNIQTFISSLGNRNASIVAIASLAILLSSVGGTAFVTWLLVRSSIQVNHKLDPYAMLGSLALQNASTPEKTFARMKKEEENSKKLAALHEADQKKQADEMIREGKALMESGKTKAAIDKFQTATQVSRKNGEAHLWLAKAHVQEKSISNAIDAYCHAERVALEPSQREQILGELANVYSHADNHRQRLKIIEQLCSEFPQTIDYRVERAHAAYLAKETAKSIEYFEALVAHDRDQLTKEQLTTALLEIACIHSTNMRIPETLKACDRLLSHDAKSPLGRYLRMMFYLEDHKPIDALNDYQKLRRLEKKETWMVERFVESLERHSQHAAMITPLNDLIANDESDQIGRWYLLRSSAHAHLGNIELAKNDGELAQSHSQLLDSNVRDAVAQINRDIKRIQKEGISYAEILDIRKRPINLYVESSIVGRGSQNRNSPAPRHTEGLYDWLSPGQAAALGAGYGLMPNNGLMQIPR
ncbi:MAG: tetratricopeptide repeat protein [Pirellula sp.]